MKTRFRFLFFLVPAAFAGLGALALMFIWNWLMPGLFGFGVITFLQALGIFVLIRILTWGGRWSRWFYWNRFAYAYPGNCYPHQRHRYWQLMKEKWDQMSPEEKSKWRTSGCRPGYPFDTPEKEEPVKA
jgi:hypothetical protein